MEAPLIPVKDLSLPQLADEYSIVRQRMMAWKPNVNPDSQRFQELAQELLERHSHVPPAVRITVPGEKFIVPISPQENKTTITDEEAVFKTIRRRGLEAILGAYSITLAKARKLLTDKQQQKWMKTERTGPREIGEPVLKQQTGATAA